MMKECQIFIGLFYQNNPPLPHESSREVVKKKRKGNGSSWLKDNPAGLCAVRLRMGVVSVVERYGWDCHTMQSCGSEGIYEWEC